MSIDEDGAVVLAEDLGAVRPPADGLPRQAAGGSASSTDLRPRLQAIAAEAEKRWKDGRWVEAIRLVAEITRLDPDSAQAHRDLGMTLLSCGRVVEAAFSLRRAVELRPDYADAMVYLVQALEGSGRMAEATLYCHKLSRIAHDAADRSYFAVKALLHEGLSEEAEREAERLLTLAPEHGHTLHRIGMLLADLGKFEDAKAVLIRAIEATPTAFATLAEIKRMKDEDRGLMSRMEALLDQRDLPAVVRLAIHFGLGKAHDDLAEYGKAIAHYDAGNRLRAMSIRFNRKAYAGEVDRIVRTFTAETLTNLARSLKRPKSSEDEAPVLIVGMPRSGTTLVEQILSSHPAVAAGGELSYWPQRLAAIQTADRGRIGPSRILAAADGYLSLLRALGPTSLRVTDKMPRNYELLWLVRLSLPGARIIHCRRHPVDTCLSNYFTNFASGHDYAWDRGDLAFFYRQYERLMAHWRAVVPSDRFIEVDYEALVADREAETRRLVAFVGLDWDDACLAPERNGRIVKTASKWQARQPVYATSVERWRRYEPWLGELGALAPVKQS